MADEYQKKYRIPSLTTDAIVLRKHKNDNYHDILLVTRGNDPYEGKLAFPGGFVDYGEEPEYGCIRELKEETELDGKDIELLTVRGNPKRDPRRHVVSIFYLVNVDQDANPKGADDAKDAKFYDLKDIIENNKEQLAFDHYGVIEELVEKKFKDLYKNKDSEKLKNKNIPINNNITINNKILIPKKKNLINENGNSNEISVFSKVQEILDKTVEKVQKVAKKNVLNSNFDEKKEKIEKIKKITNDAIEEINKLTKIVVEQANYLIEKINGNELTEKLKHNKMKKEEELKCGKCNKKYKCEILDKNINDKSDKKHSIHRGLRCNECGGFIWENN